MNPDHWAQGLILKLLKATHGQWIYRNIQIHDAVTGTQVTLRKEAIQREIEDRGSSPKNVIFSNGSKILSEYSNPLY